ncbi:MAG: heavy-metal-associated domain-containing protein [bacterium]|nr:heavy-metal-associated domain-containing protein [bacterium]
MSKKEIIHIQGIHCVSCVMKIENAIKNVKGAQSVSVDLKGEKATVEFDENEANIEDLKNAIVVNGYQVIE